MAIAAPAVALMMAPTAHADTQKCRTHPIPGATVTDCYIYTDDGGSYSTQTYCDNSGNCSTH